jgi:hypothetical protein
LTGALISITDDRAIEQARVSSFSCCACQEGKRGRSRHGIRAHGNGASDPLDRGSGTLGFAELVPVHRQRVREEAGLVEPLSDEQCLPCPLRGRGQPLLGQQRAECDAERYSGLAEKCKGCTIDEPVGGASFESGDERP